MQLVKLTQASAVVVHSEDEIRSNKLSDQADTIHCELRAVPLTIAFDIFQRVEVACMRRITRCATRCRHLALMFAVKSLHHDIDP